MDTRWLVHGKVLVLSPMSQNQRLRKGYPHGNALVIGWKGVGSVTEVSEPTTYERLSALETRWLLLGKVLVLSQKSPNRLLTKD
jgi:hypothetical protein